MMDDQNVGPGSSVRRAPPSAPSLEPDKIAAAAGESATGASSAEEQPGGELSFNQRNLGATSSNITQTAAVPSVTSDQKTVISKASPAPLPPFTRAGVQDLGRILVGERLGHFVLEEFVGGGGMGAVFRATDIELGRTVAVKVVSGVHNDDETLRRFKNEAQSAARLDHQNIARVYYVGVDKGWHFIVFEFINGVNVRDLVEHKGPLPLDEAFHYTLQVAEALAHASERDVVHRDIKPSNVLVMQDGTVKLVDMGLARRHQVESVSDDLTASGVTLGTFDYISPEQARDPRNADVRSDLYSLGCTLYYILTGRPPFPEGTVLQKLLSHSSDAPPDPRDVRPDLPEEVTELVHKLLAKNAKDRFQTPGELIARILLLANRWGLVMSGRHAAVVVAPAPAFSRLEFHLPWLVPTALLMLIVLLIETFSAPRPFAVHRPELLPALADQKTTPQRTTPVSDETATPRSDRGTKPVPGADQAERQRSPASSQAASAATNTAKVEPASADVTVPLGQDDLAALFGPGADGFSLEPTSDGAGVNATEVLDGPPAKTVPTTASETRTQSPAATTAAPVRRSDAVIRRVIVAATLDPTPEDAVVCRTLAAALQRAAEVPTVQAIELWFNGEIFESPLQATVKERLVIRAAPGYQPLIRFRGETDDFGGSRHMIELTGGSTAWEDVHLRFDLPIEPSEDWALFALRDIQSLELENCTLTIQNTDANGIEWHQDVSFFEFEPPTVPNRMDMGMMMPMGDSADPPMEITPPRLELTNCAARGEASLVRADVAFPMIIDWQKGLLVSNKRFFDFGGATEATAYDGAAVQIELKRVTAMVEQGFGRLELDSSGPLLIDIELDVSDSVIAMQADSPYLDYQGVPAIDRAEATLTLRGGRNFYPIHPPSSSGVSAVLSRVRWRLTTAAGAVVDYPMDFVDFPWYEEKGSKEAVMWKRPPPVAEPSHRGTKWDFQMDPQLNNPARTAGFDFDALPAFPEFAPPEGPRTSSDAL